MARSALVVLLVAVCCIGSLNAWPWDRKTTTTEAPVISRDKFLALLQKASANVTAEVAKSHELVQAAEQDGKEAEAKSNGVSYVASYLKRFTDRINKYATAEIKGTEADVSSCLGRFADDRDEVNSYIIPALNELVERDVKDIHDTASGADALLTNIAAVLARGKEEAAKPDGEYGGGVDAILKDAAKVVDTAVWNNAHIETLIYDFKFAGDVTVSLSDASTDMNAAMDYAALCVRRTLRRLSQ